jgi:hypothetical protein
VHSIVVRCCYRLFARDLVIVFIMICQFVGFVFVTVCNSLAVMSAVIIVAVVVVVTVVVFVLCFLLRGDA